MAQKVVCFSLCYYVLLIWLLLWPLPCLRNQRFSAVQLAQGGPQCSDRRALCWGTPNKQSALATMVQAPRSDPDPAPFQSLCADHYRARVWISVRLLRSFTALPSACALRLPVIRLWGAYRMHQRSKSGSDSPSSSYVPVVAFVAFVAFVALAELVRCEVNVPGSSV